MSKISIRLHKNVKDGRAQHLHRLYLGKLNNIAHSMHILCDGFISAVYYRRWLDVKNCMLNLMGTRNALVRLHQF